MDHNEMIERQRRGKRLVETAVHANVSSMVDYILERAMYDDDGSAPFSWDDVTNLTPNLEDMDLADLAEYVIDNGGYNVDDLLYELKDHAADLSDEWQARVDDALDDENGAYNWSEKLAIFQGFLADLADTEAALDAEADLRRIAENVADDAGSAEIYEWYIVDNWLARELAGRGECVIDNWIWGRQATGQAIYLDHEIQEIAMCLAWTADKADG